MAPGCYPAPSGGRRRREILARPDTSPAPRSTRPPRVGAAELPMQPAVPPSSSPPRLSVVVPVFDEEPNLEPLVSEIAAALAGIDFELLVVDDGSRDGSAATLARLLPREPRLRVLRHDTNYGQSAALATGFAAARGELV